MRKALRIRLQISKILNKAVIALAIVVSTLPRPGTAKEDPTGIAGEVADSALAVAVRNAPIRADLNRQSLESSESSENSTASTCPSGPKPHDPTIKEQLDVVDLVAPTFSQQIRRYPGVPHLKPSLVADAMINGKYLREFTFVIAHRGVHSESGYTENGLSGIWRAFKAGADGVEIDIKTDCQNKTLLGHDFAVGRELDTPTFNLYANFPSLDPVYSDSSKWPFWTNNSPNDPDNPNRLNNYIGSFWNKKLKDQFDFTSIFGDGQITAIQGMYYTAKYAPMMVWLDIKNSSDLISSAREVAEVRSVLPKSNKNLDYIGLKLGAGTLRDPLINFNPAKNTNTPGLIYFAVLGLGDLDRVKADGGGDLEAGLQKYCNPDNGCIGVELAHKYENAPTQSAYDFVNSKMNTQIAGFHTVPQYDWANFVNQEIPSESEKTVRNFNRTFPRTDGSCCFALDDSLNIGLNSSEIIDRRGSYNWNMKSFTTITSDDAVNILRKLSVLGRRPKGVIDELGGDSTQYYRKTDDGLFAIFSPTRACFVNSFGNDDGLKCGEFSKNSIFSFSLSPSGENIFELTNTTGNTVVVKSGSLITLSTTADVEQTPVEFQIDTSGKPGSITTRATGQDWLVDNAGRVTLAGVNDQGTEFNFIPIRQAQIEAPLAADQTENRIGPPGSVLWCDEGQVCGATHSPATIEQIAFGVDGQWVYKYVFPISVVPLLCSVETFGSDPAPGQSKACYRTPYYGGGKLSRAYGPELIPEGARLPPDISSIVYGYQFPDSDYWYGNYGVPDQLGSEFCQNFPGAPDPAPSLQGRVCKVIEGPTPDLPNFAACGSNNVGDDCSFVTPHSVALSYRGEDGDWRYTYKTFTKGLRCSADEFGIKATGPLLCFARVISSNDPKVTNFTYCSAVGKECIVNGSGNPSTGDRFLAAYADKVGNRYYAQIQGTFVCSLEAFGKTGTPDPSAMCFYRLY